MADCPADCTFSCEKARESDRHRAPKQVRHTALTVVAIIAIVTVVLVVVRRRGPVRLAAQTVLSFRTGVGTRLVFVVFHH